ncbi:MAG: family 78 glycoside hydrolase catalytic domain [Clostridia bacterium]|nr:family 78 glycoside hydrolase catalytic domain [Clostridia bacterium]
MCNIEDYVPAPLFRKSFNLDSCPDKAEITICGLGFYELYINGINITKGPLAPYITNPEHVLYYDNYDVHEFLNIGENVIGVLLGNGMRNPYGGFVWEMDKSPCRRPVSFALSFEADGEVVFEADDSFKTHPSAIVYDDLRMGYCYDSGLEIDSWDKPDFDDSNWQNAIYEPTPSGTKKLCTVEPITVSDEIKAVEIKHFERLPFAHNKWYDDAPPFEETYRDNVYVYDFGINTAGVTKLKINGNPGQRIVIRHGEDTVRGEFSVNTTVFQRGEENSRIYREYGQTDVFICKGGYEEFIPKFKYDGFRYAYVEGLEPEQATPDALTYLVMHSDICRKSAFSCSDDVINKLYECAINSDYSNFYYFPTDCPHREKLGWTGDAWFSAEQMLLNLDTANSLREWLFNIRQTQLDNGALPCIIPTVGWGYDWGSGPVFDSVCVQLPYYLYKYTGDKGIISENRDMIMKYLGYAYSKRNEEGLIVFGLGDWIDPFEDVNGFISSPLEFTATVSIFDIAQKASFLFGQAGLTEDSIYAQDIANELRKSIREHLIDFDTMTVKGDCQTSQCLGIAKGIFNADEIDKAADKLADIIRRDGDINKCGILGLRYIFHVLADIGKADLAYKIITSKHHTCYGYWIENGATSLWERFKKYDDIKSDNSKNHHFHGDISSWFIQELAGLKPNPSADDISYFEISPSFVSGLSYVKAEYVSKFGKVLVNWTRTDEKITLCVKAPKGTHGRLIIKGGYVLSDDTHCTSWCADAGCDISITLNKVK